MARQIEPVPEPPGPVPDVRPPARSGGRNLPVLPMATGGMGLLVVVLLIVVLAGGSSGGADADDGAAVATRADVGTSGTEDETPNGGDSEAEDQDTEPNDSPGAGDADPSDEEDLSGQSDPEGLFVTAGYAVVPPAGWIRDAKEIDKGGFTESRWHLSGNPDVFVKVNHTRSFTGSAVEGARPVRRQVSRAADYEEFGWRKDGDTGWFWEFSYGGDRKVDLFRSGCSGGIAALGAAPTAEFATHRDELLEFVRSLEPRCDDESAPSDENPGATDDADEGSESAPNQAKSLNTPTRALRRHFQRINSGDYEAARRLLSARYRASNPRWIDQPQAARPSVNVIDVGPASFGNGSATVRIKFYGRDQNDTNRSDTQCRRFEGNARMVKDGSAWRYEPSGNDYEVTVMDGSLSVCPS